MTVIAYRDGVLAADTLITSNLDRAGQCVKIHREGDWIMGAAGTLGSLQPLVNWIKETNADFAKPVEYPSGMDGCGILVNKDGEGFYVDSEARFVTRINAPFLAIGSGGTTARTAMYLSCSAIEAVDAAIDLDVGCGGKATYLTIAGDEDLTLVE